MTQNINLYSADLRPSRELLTLGNVALAMSAALCLIIALAIYGMSRTTDEQRSFKAVETRLQEMQAQVTLYAVQQGQRRQDPELLSRLAQAEKRLANRRAVLARLQGGDLGGRQGFSGIFSGLAEVSVDGVWLTRVEVRAGGSDLALGGRVLSESQLPRYVEALGANPNFAGREFGALEVRSARDDKSPATQAEPAVPASLAFSLGGFSTSGAHVPRGRR